MKAGIICDDYKVKLFKEEFEREGLEVLAELPYEDGLTVFHIEYNDSITKSKIEKVYNKLQTYFKRQREVYGRNN